MQDIIKQAIDNGHIIVKEITAKNKPYSRVEFYCVITEKGFRYLQQIEAFPWMKELPYFDSLNVFGDKGISKRKYQRMGLIATAAVMSEAAGAVTYLPLFTTSYFSEGEGQSSNHNNKVEAVQGTTLHLFPMLSEVTQNNSDLRFDRLGLNLNDTSFLSSPNFIFTDSIRAKYMVAEYRGKADINDYRRAEFTGILDTHFKSVLVYTAPSFGLRWREWSLYADRTVYTLWKQSHALADTKALYQDKDIGLIFIKNAKEFEDLYKDKCGMRSKGDYLGKGFQKFYAVPITYTGARHLRWLMNTDDKDQEEKLKQIAVEKGQFKYLTASTIAEMQLFSLMKNGTRWTIGIYMDFVKVQSLMSYMEAKPGQYGIICFEWQKEYYKRLWPNIAYATIHNR